MLIYKIAVAVAVVALAVVLLTALVRKKDTYYHLQNRGDLGPLTRSDITYLDVAAPSETNYDGTITAASWRSIYPEIADSMDANGNNTAVVDYLEQDPYLVNIYDNYGFSKDYGSARGHAFTLVDVAKTERPHATANCLTCKTPNFAKLVQDQGVGVYTMDFDEVYDQINANGEAISCYTCHGNEAGSKGKLMVTHEYVGKALGKNVSTIDPGTLSCGQCHIEYYFTAVDSNGDGKLDAETMMPYHSIAEMSPEKILAYYEAAPNKDGGVGFYDWIQPGTGTHMLKAQHPEMETYLQGVHAPMGLNCADCHMEIKMNEDGTVYHSHELVSPLASEALLESCAKCHGDTNMTQLVHRIQDQVTTRETEIGNKLSAFKDALADANKGFQEGAPGAKTEEELNAIRKLYREAQWFFDFCYVENAEGAHNSQLANRCLDTAAEKIAEGMALLGVEN
jgi:nitrite reductase (cytochrome c-552)